MKHVYSEGGVMCVMEGVKHVYSEGGVMCVKE